MSYDAAIDVDGVSKCFNVYENPSDRLKQALYPRFSKASNLLGLSSLGTDLGNRRRFSEYWALQDISFYVRPGETVGIVGKNGSGKSTLLQMIAGTLTPTAGKITVNGRVAALLELGSGFNPEFTGIENVLFNGSVLGLTTSEIDAKMDAILEFADLGDFVDKPVKTYSSGMIVRLAFAVQAQIDPDILIVDEALAVGDAKFQAKCFARLKTLRDAGTSILLVTHSTEQVVTHCDRAILLSDGRIARQGAPKEVCNAYLDLLFGKQPEKPALENAASTADDPGAVDLTAISEPATSGNAYVTRPYYNPYEYRWGDGAAEIADYRLYSERDGIPAHFEPGSVIHLDLGFRFLRNVHRPIFGLTIKTKDGVTVYGTNTERQDPEVFGNVGEIGSHGAISFRFKCNLGPGDYFISVGIASRDGEEVTPHDRRYDSIHLHVNTQSFFGIADLEASIKLIEQTHDEKRSD